MKLAPSGPTRRDYTIYPAEWDCTMEYRNDCLLWFWIMQMVSVSSRPVLLVVLMSHEYYYGFRFSIRIIRSGAPRTKINGSYVASRISSSMTFQYEYSSNIGYWLC